MLSISLLFSFALLLRSYCSSDCISCLRRSGLGISQIPLDGVFDRFGDITCTWTLWCWFVMLSIIYILYSMYRLAERGITKSKARGSLHLNNQNLRAGS